MASAYSALLSARDSFTRVVLTLKQVDVVGLVTLLHGMQLGACHALRRSSSLGGGSVLHADCLQHANAVHGSHIRYTLRVRPFAER